MESLSRTAAHESEEHVVVSKLGQEFYAIQIAVVQEIIRMQPITVVPEAAGRVEGVISFRGHVIPVLDLRRVCGFSPAEPTSATRIVVVAREGDGAYGLIVDSVTEVLRFPKADIEPVSSILGGSPVLRGIAKLPDRLISLLDLENVLPETDAAQPPELSIVAA
jgi:purine-binding chemotaxis protein CheW